MGILREIRFEVSEGPRHREFNLGTHYVSAMFHDALNSVESGPVRKMLVCPGSPSAVFNMNDVVQADVPFDFETYWKSDDLARKEMVADGILEGARMLADHFGWAERGFVEARESIRGKRITEVDFGKAVSSPSRRKSAQIRYYFGPRDVKIVAVVRDRESDEILTEVPLVETEPHELRYVPYLGRIRWVSEDELRLVPRQKGLQDVVRSIDG